ncbi:rod shape-determining protein [Candidatus Parcubacteria bacterium]|nr:rod shape-determining protein [Candidatus Parcubacteria bacterium]
MADIKETIRRFFSHDIGIDLGTANTLVYVRGQGIVLSEPSVVAVNEKTGRVVAVGNQAKEMLGRTPSHITAVKPLVDGVISDFEVTEEMLAYLLSRVQGRHKLLGPRVVVGVPSGITSVETRAVRDAARNAGAGIVYIVEEPMAAAIGLRLPIFEPVGNMIVDIGGGTSDIALISLGGLVRSKNLRVAGEKFNQDIISYIRSQFKILIGEKTAEVVKMAIGSVLPGETVLEARVKGRDLVTGLPREVVITDADMREALSPSIESLINALKEVVEIAPPDILNDVLERGIYLTGGGALIQGLGQLMESELNIPVHLAPDPVTAVARGTGIILEDLPTYESILVQNEDDLPQK